MESIVSSKFMGRVHSKLQRIKQNFISWRYSKYSGFETKFVAEQRELLDDFLRRAENLNDDVDSTKKFLKQELKTLALLGKFIMPQVLAVCYLLGLYKGFALHAAQAPILDTRKKEHYKEFKKIGVEPEHMDLCMLVVALKHFTVPLTIENTGCEVKRKKKDVYDFKIKGQMSYGMRPVPGCNYKHPDFEVHVKKAGPGRKWVKAVRDEQGRWRHPGGHG